MRSFRMRIGTRSRVLRPALLLCALALSSAIQPPIAYAGNNCEARPLSPQGAAEAAATALSVAAELDRHDAPLAIVSRIGTDLSKHGLIYSHAGFVVRDHPDGRWTVVHLLSDCSAEGSGLYAQGLVDFFADDLITQDARITWLRPEIAERLSQRMATLARDPLYTPRYNLIARPGSRDYQNSTAWILEHLAAALSEQAPVRNRAEAYRIADARGFRPDRIHIPYTKRIMGGLFAKNMSFTDHPVSTRLSGEYPVVTVRAILRWLNDTGIAEHEAESHRGVWSTPVGPG